MCQLARQRLGPGGGLAQLPLGEAIAVSGDQQTPLLRRQPGRARQPLLLPLGERRLACCIVTQRAGGSVRRRQGQARQPQAIALLVRNAQPQLVTAEHQACLAALKPCGNLDGTAAQSHASGGLLNHLQAIIREPDTRQRRGARIRRRIITGQHGRQPVTRGKRHVRQGAQPVRIGLRGRHLLVAHLLFERLLRKRRDAGGLEQRPRHADQIGQHHDDDDHHAQPGRCQPQTGKTVMPQTTTLHSGGINCRHEISPRKDSRPGVSTPQTHEAGMAPRLCPSDDREMTKANQRASTSSSPNC